MHASLTAAQRSALTIGAVLLVVAGVVLLPAAAFMARSTPAATPIVVDDPTHTELPKLGVFSGSVTVYGRAGVKNTLPSQLGCRLLTRGGAEQSTARMSSLAVGTAPAVRVSGRNLAPLFTVRGYPAGSVLSCARTKKAAPLAVGQPNTFGGDRPMVAALAAAAGLTCLVLGAGALTILRRSRRS